MPTPTRKKLESKETSGNAALKATNAPETPFQRNGLKKLSSKELDREIRASAKGWHMLTREAQAFERERLLPQIKEVARRIKAGKRVAGFTGVEAYIKSLGLPPSLVRKWRFNERKKNGEKSASGLMQNLNAPHPRRLLPQGHDLVVSQGTQAWRRGCGVPHVPPQSGQIKLAGAKQSQGARR